MKSSSVAPQGPGGYYHGGQMASQQPAVIQQAPIVDTQPTTDRVERFNGKCSIFLGAIAIVLQVIAIITHGFLMGIYKVIYAGRVSFFFAAMPSVWSGVLIFIAAGFAIAAGKTKTRCLIVTTMVMSIIASVFAGMFLCFTGIGLGVDATRWSYYGRRDLQPVTVGFDAFMFLISLAQCVITIWIAALCCQGTCCGKTRPQAVQQQAAQQYHNVTIQNAGFNQG